MWRRSPPPRMRRRLVLQILCHTTLSAFFPPFLSLYSILKDPAHQGGALLSAAALAPGLQVADVTALVPAPILPDRLGLSPSNSAGVFCLPRLSGCLRNTILCFVANLNTVDMFFYMLNLLFWILVLQM